MLQPDPPPRSRDIPLKGQARASPIADTETVTWFELEEQWLRDGRHVYFAPDDDSAIRAFEQHLRHRELQFVVHNRSDVPAIVFASPPRNARSVERDAQRRAA
jgi:hypothetical protein